MNNDSIVRARERIEKALFGDRRVLEPRIKATLDAFESVDPQLRHLIAGSDSEIADLPSASLTPETIEMPNVHSLTTGEHTVLDAEILAATMGLSEIDAPPDPPNWLRARGICSESVASNGEIAERVLAIAKTTTHDPAAATLLAKRVQPNRASSELAGKFVRSLVAHAKETDPDSTLTAFLKSFAAGDRAGMRAAVRAVLVAEA